MEFNKDKVLPLEQNDPMKWSGLRNSSAKREPGCPGEHQIGHGSTVCSFEMMKPNHILGYISKSIASRLREVIALLYASAIRNGLLLEHKYQQTEMTVGVPPK